MSAPFEEMLSGGHPNSLGRTIEVVEAVLCQPDDMGALFDCYGSADEVVRLRVSNAMRRVQAVRPDLILPFIDKLLTEIAALDQPSAQWTLPKLFAGAEQQMSADQRKAAIAIVQRNLAEHDDWIVLNNSIEYLADRAAQDAALKDWLMPHLARCAGDQRKSVAKRAAKAMQKLKAE